MIKRLDDLEKKILWVEKEGSKQGIKLKRPSSVESFL